MIPGKVKAPVSTPAAAPSKPNIATKNYKVRSGDGLIALAKQFGISTQALAGLNGIGARDSLYVGQTLKVPANADTSVTSSNSSSSSSSSASSVATSSYKVKSGETLIGIANSIGVSAEQVAAVNSSFDANARLQRGQTIKVPASKAQVDIKLNDKPVSYKIQSGDTLIGVANRYKIGVSDLAAANNLSTTSNLILGRSLTIPANGSGGSSSSSSTSSNTSSNKTSTSSSSNGKKLGNTENYKVQSGDGLIALAARFGVSVQDLAATNNIAANAQLQRGQTLKVPKVTVSYTVGSGDSLIGLARKYGVSTKELADMNSIAADTMLQRGQKLTVPNR